MFDFLFDCFVRVDNHRLNVNTWQSMEQLLISVPSLLVVSLLNYNGENWLKSPSFPIHSQDTCTFKACGVGSVIKILLPYIVFVNLILFFTYNL